MVMYRESFISKQCFPYWQKVLPKSEIKNEKNENDLLGF
jgi:hypothetical protein